MDSGFVIYLLFLGAAFGLILIRDHYRATVVSWARQAWQWEGHTVECGPDGVCCYGTKPGENYRSRTGHYGALGIVDGRLAFATRFYEYVAMPLDSVRWLAYRTITVLDSGRKKIDISALIVHCERWGEWYVFAFGPEGTYGIARELSKRCNLHVHEMGNRSESHGPMPAIWMTQDIYGQWQTGPRGQLFLAPDRVLFAENERWDQAVMLADIREVGAFERPDLLHKIDPWAEDLLRIECQTTPADKPSIFGFVVRDAEEWAAAIQSLSPARIAFRSGQKKKN